jgi:hypothetical protein
MEGRVEGWEQEAPYPVTVTVQPALDGRNRLTTAFRFFFGIPHLILVGGPVAVISSIGWSTEEGTNWGFGSGGVLSVVAGVGAVISWFAILFTGRHPDGLWKLGSYYLSWRVRAIAYMTLLRDEYPPFGEGAYPAELQLSMPPQGTRDRWTVALRFLLAIPHLFLVWLLSLAWAFTTALAWISILITGRYPETLYGFAIGVLAWSMRVEAYMLLLRDEYPPFTLRA